MTEPDHDLATAALHKALEGVLTALVALDALGPVEAPHEALDAALGDDESYQQARSEFRQVHQVVADLLDDEMVTFEIESAAHTMVTAAVEVGFRVGLASRSWS